jgi:hypothetical protein
MLSMFKRIVHCGVVCKTVESAEICGNMPMQMMYVVSSWDVAALVCQFAMSKEFHN